MTPRRPYPVVVIGAGRLGGAIARALKKRRWPIHVLPHSEQSVRGAFELGLPLASTEHLEAATLCLLCVPDARVREVAEEARAHVGRRTALVHCAGALTLDALPGEPRGSFHPLCAVSSPLDSLAGHAVAISTRAPQIERRLRALAAALELTPLQVPEGQRAAYHAGAVMSAGGLVTLAAAAMEAWVHAGIREEEALPALLDLMRSALRGVEARGLRAGLTGPLPRGDAEVVASHLKGLPAALRPLYRELGQRALKLKSPDLSSAQRRALKRALKE